MSGKIPPDPNEGGRTASEKTLNTFSSNLVRRKDVLKPDASGNDLGIGSLQSSSSSNPDRRFHQASSTTTTVKPRTTTREEEIHIVHNTIDRSMVGRYNHLTKDHQNLHPKNAHSITRDSTRVENENYTAGNDQQEEQDDQGIDDDDLVSLLGDEDDFEEFNPDEFEDEEEDDDESDEDSETETNPSASPRGSPRGSPTSSHADETEDEDDEGAISRRTRAHVSLNQVSFEELDSILENQVMPLVKEKEEDDLYNSFLRDVQQHSRIASPRRKKRKRRLQQQQEQDIGGEEQQNIGDPNLTTTAASFRSKHHSIGQKNTNNRVLSSSHHHHDASSTSHHVKSSSSLSSSPNSTPRGGDDHSSATSFKSHRPTSPVWSDPGGGYNNEDAYIPNEDLGYLQEDDKLNSEWDREIEVSPEEVRDLVEDTKANNNFVGLASETNRMNGKSSSSSRQRPNQNIITDYPPTHEYIFDDYSISGFVNRRLRGQEQQQREQDSQQLKQQQPGGGRGENTNPSSPGRIIRESTMNHLVSSPVRKGFRQWGDDDEDEEISMADLLNTDYYGDDDEDYHVVEKKNDEGRASRRTAGHHDNNVMNNYNRTNRKSNLTSAENDLIGTLAKERVRQEQAAAAKAAAEEEREKDRKKKKKNKFQRRLQLDEKDSSEFIGNDFAEDHQEEKILK
eukprot:g2809.t1